MTVTIAGAFVVYLVVVLSATQRVMRVFPELRRMGAAFIGAHIRAINSLPGCGSSHRQQALSSAVEDDQTMAAQQSLPQVSPAGARLAALEQRLEALIDSPETDAGQIDRILAEMDRIRVHPDATQ